MTVLLLQMQQRAGTVIDLGGFRWVLIGLLIGAALFVISTLGPKE